MFRYFFREIAICQKKYRSDFSATMVQFQKPIQLSWVAKHKLVDGKGVIVELMAELGLKIR